MTIQPSFRVSERDDRGEDRRPDQDRDARLQTAEHGRAHQASCSTRRALRIALRRTRARGGPASRDARRSCACAGSRHATQSATKRRAMYLSPAIVSPFGITALERMPIAASREFGPIEPRHPAVLMQAASGPPRWECRRTRSGGGRAARVSAETLKPVDATTPVTSSHPGEAPCAFAMCTRRPAGPGLDLVDLAHQLLEAPLGAAPLDARVPAAARRRGAFEHLGQELPAARRTAVPGRRRCRTPRTGSAACSGPARRASGCAGARSPCRRRRGRSPTR